MLIRAQRAWREIRAASAVEQAYWAALGLLLLLGTFLRLNGYLGRQISFWLDEALWAPRFANAPLLSLSIRPIGFVWLTRQVISWFGATELWFRFIPNLSSLLSLWLMPYVASRLFESRALRVLLVLPFAIHPALIDLSKEFKPYTFEVLVHLLTVILYLRYEQTRKRAYFYALLGYLPISFLLAYNIAFALPGLLLLVLRLAVRERARKLVALTVLSGAVCCGVVLALNSLALAKVAKNGETETYWGQKYDLFYAAPLQGPAEQSRLSWTLHKTAEMTEMIGLQRDVWMGNPHLSERLSLRLGAADRWFWFGLSLLGAAALIRKRRVEALLWLAPLPVLVVVNALGKWPLGEFRTNLFACVYLFPLPVFAVELLTLLARKLWGYAAAALILLDVLVGFFVSVDWHGHKHVWCRDGTARDVLPALYQLRKQELAANRNAKRARLVLDLYSYRAFDYYLTVHPTFMQEYRDFNKQFVTDRVGSNRLVEITEWRLRGRGPVYAMAAKPSSVKALEQLATRTHVVMQQRVDAQVLILVLDK